MSDLAVGRGEFCPKVCRSGEVDIDIITKGIAEKIEQELGVNWNEKNNRDYELKMLKKENEALQCQNEELMCRLKEAQEQDEKRLEMMKLKDAAEQLVAIIRRCYDLHTSIIVQCDGIKVVQDTMYIPLK